MDKQKDTFKHDNLDLKETRIERIEFKERRVTSEYKSNNNEKRDTLQVNATVNKEARNKTADDFEPIKSRGINGEKNLKNFMLISKENRRKIYEYFYQEGVLVAKKDFEAQKHSEIDVPNLQVIKAMQSLTSRGIDY